MKSIAKRIQAVTALALLIAGCGSGGGLENGGDNGAPVAKTTQALCSDDSECFPYICNGGACESDCTGHPDCAEGATCNEDFQCVPDGPVGCGYYRIVEAGHGAGIDCYESCWSDDQCVDEGHCESSACVAD